jgi:predicted DNA-binding protein (UPF0251 family)
VTAVVTGQRIQTVDVEHSLGFRVRDFGKALTEIQGIARKTVTSRGKVSGQEVAADVARMEKLRLAEFAEMQKILGAARRLGVPEENIQTMLKDSLPDDVANQLLEGDYAPYAMTPQTVKQMLESRPEEFVERFAGWHKGKPPEEIAEYASSIVWKIPYKKPTKSKKTDEQYQQELRQYEMDMASSKMMLETLGISHEKAWELLKNHQDSKGKKDYKAGSGRKRALDTLYGR